jgi:hypothetical protein
LLEIRFGRQGPNRDDRVSLMPEGLEKDLSNQDVANVISFVRSIQAPSKSQPPLPRQSDRAWSMTLARKERSGCVPTGDQSRAEFQISATKSRTSVRLFVALISLKRRSLVNDLGPFGRGGENLGA